MISLAVAAAGWVGFITRRLRRPQISTTFATRPRLVQSGDSGELDWNGERLLYTVPAVKAEERMGLVLDLLRRLS